MKICNTCGVEICTKDGDNHCGDCESGRKPKRKKSSLTRKQRDSIMADLGLVKVRGALGGTYYE